MKKVSRQFKSMLLATLLGALSAEAQTTINSITVLIDFPDQAATVPRDSIFQLFNKASGYKSYGLNGSVRQYWKEVTGGKLDYTSPYVIGYLRASKPRAEYETYAKGGLDKLLAEVLPQIENQSFTGLTLRPGTTNEIWSLNVLVQGAWTESLRPVAFNLARPIRILNNGVEAFLKEGGNSVNDGINQVSLSYFTHETGHSTFWWPEQYQKESRTGNLGNFCLMAIGGINRDDNPVPPNPGLRIKNGWISNIVNLNVASNTTFTVTANDMNKTFKYTNPNNPREYYLVEAIKKTGRFSEAPDEGLAIWYIDEAGGLKLPVQSNYSKVNLVEADGLGQLLQGGSGDGNDLFDANGKSSFSDFTVPNAKWKDGSLSGLSITNISTIGTTMSFRVEVKNFAINATTDANGKIAPAGTIRVNSGASQTFQLTPDLGYVVNRILVNGVASIPSSNTFTVNNINANTSVKVEYKKATSGFELPAPWKQIDFGTNVLGEVYYKDGVFATKKFGWDIWNREDNFQYIYQTLSGDGEIVALVSEQDATSEWAKSGVMIRESLTSDSKHAFMCVTPYQGPAFQNRTLKGGDSENQNIWGNLSKWVKLKRAGDVFTSFYSNDGVNWTLLKSVTIPMVKDVFVGLASVGSTDLAKNAAKFDKVKFTPASINLLTKYNVPRATALPGRVTRYSNVHKLGTGGPVVSNVRNSVFNWDFQNNLLQQLTLETSNGSPFWFTDLKNAATHTLKQANPSITLRNTGWAGMDGSYYVNFDGDNLVLVEKTGAYALYFSSSSTAPAREAEVELSAAEAESLQLNAVPNIFTGFTTIDLTNRPDVTALVVTNMSGRVQETIAVETGSFVELGHNYPAGMFIIKAIGETKADVIKIIKE